MSAGQSTARPPEQASGRPGSRSDVWFLGVMFLGYLAFAADRTVLSAMLKPMSASLAPGATEVFGISGAAWLASAQFIGVLAFVLLSGALSDMVGQRRVILVGVGVFTVTTWMIGLAQNLEEAFVFRLVSGFGEGLFWPGAMSAVANYFGRSKGLALGIFYAGFDIGGAFGNGTGAAAFALTSDWRTAFFVAPLVGLPVLAGVAASGGMFARASVRTGRLSLVKGAAEVSTRGKYAVVLVFAFFATWASIWQVAYLPYYYSTVLGASVPAAGLVAAAVLVSGMAGKVLVGRVSDWVRRDRLLFGLSAAVALLYLAFFSESDFALGVGLALGMGFFSGAVFPVMQALASDSSGGRTGTALGLTTTFQSSATVIGTLLPGSLFALGVGRAIALGALVPAVAAAAIAFFLREPRREGTLGQGTETPTVNSGSHGD